MSEPAPGARQQKAWLDAALAVARLALREADVERLLEGAVARLTSDGLLRACTIALTAGPLAGTRRSAGGAAAVEPLDPDALSGGPDAVTIVLASGGREVGRLLATGEPTLATDERALAALDDIARDLAIAIDAAATAGRGGEALLRDFISNAPAALAMFDRDMRYVAASRRWIDDYGLASVALIGRSHYDVFTDLPDEWRAIHRRCLEGATERCDDDTFVAPDGRTEHLRWEVRPWRDGAGRIGGIVIFTEPTTAWRKAELDLRASESRLASALAMASLGAWELELETETLWLSEQARQIFELEEGAGPTTLAQVRGRQLPGDVARVEETLKRVVREGESVVSESRLLMPDGRIKFVLWKGELQAGAVGSPGRLVGFVQDVTERRRVEEELRYHATLLVETGRIAKVGGWRFDVATGAGDWTDEVARIHDLDPSVPPSVALGLDFYQGPSRPLIEQAVAEVRRGQPYDLELELTSARGVSKWVRTIGHPVFQDGEVVQVVGSIQDITDLKRAAAQLNDERARLRALFDTIPDCVFLKDRDGRYLACNPRAARMLGASSSQDVIGKDDVELVGEVLAGAFRRDDLAAIVAGRPVRNEEWLDDPDSGQRRLLETIKTPMRSADGELTGVLGVSRDITQARLFQEELQRVQAHLRKLSRAVEQSPTIITITDTAGRVEYVNPRFAEVMGYGEADVVGKCLSDTSATALSPAALSEVLQGVREGHEWRGELLDRRRTGDPVWLRTVISPIREESGAVTHFVALQDDVTEIKDSEEALRQLREQLFHAQKMEAVGRLAGGIAHDFNNLLTAIGGFAGLIRDGLGPGDRLLGYAEQVVRANDRAARLTRQLLAFSRKLPLKPHPLDIAAVVREMEKMIQRLVREELALQVVTEPTSGLALAEVGLLEQVVMNLVVNASDASTTGGVIRVEVANATLDAGAAGALLPPIEPGRFVRLTVEDTGAGMTPEVIDRLFEPFFSTKEPGKGTGLGLATVYGIVQQSHGAIRVDSAPGRGTRFDIFFPRLEPQEVTSEPAPAAPDLQVKGTETILLVEDDSGVRQVFQTILAAAGYRVIEGGLPYDALALAESYAGPIDLLLSDVIMPHLRGPELAARIRRLRPGLKTLFVSGYVGDEDLDTSGARCLTKPVQAPELLRTVREVLAAGS